VIELKGIFGITITEIKNLDGDVRGEGLFLGIEFTSADGKPDTTTATYVKEELKNNFILTGTDGPFENVIKIKPPICFSNKNVDEFIDKLDEILK
jgi:ethanolamine-phosphate phospho-lyase